mgnify:CR=1 FL=1|jgi:hypothetical protein
MSFLYRVAGQGTHEKGLLSIQIFDKLFTRQGLIPQYIAEPVWC